MCAELPKPIKLVLDAQDSRVTDAPAMIGSSVVSWPDHRASRGVEAQVVLPHPVSEHDTAALS